MKRILLIAIFLLLSSQTSSAQQANSENGEIVVSAIANILPAKALARVHILIQTDAKSAKVAMGRLEELEKKLLQSTSSLSLRAINSQLSFRSLSKTSPEIKSGVAFVGEKRISLDAQQYELATLIDAVIDGGYAQIQSVESVAGNNEKNTSAAISEAIAKVKTKAEKISKEMGVQIGQMISTTVTEESLGAALLRSKKSGGMAAINPIPSKRVIVQARFRTS